MKHVVKRGDHSEIYDQRKVYASVYAAALNAHYSEKKAEDLADHVMRAVNKWAHKKAQMTSHDIREHIQHEIHDADVELLYKHHLDVN